MVTPRTNSYGKQEGGVTQKELPRRQMEKIRLRAAFGSMLICRRVPLTEPWSLHNLHLGNKAAPGWRAKKEEGKTPLTQGRCFFRARAFGDPFFCVPC